MTFIPKKTKYKKYFKRKICNQVYKKINYNSLFVGNFGLKATEYGILNSSHFEAIKQSIRKIIKKTGSIIFIKFPHQSQTKKPLGMRMGKGKGNTFQWISKIQPGMIICEINTFNKALSIRALSSAKIRLPFKTKIIIED